MTTAEEKSAPAARISWENILTSLEDGVVLIDRHGKISFFNQAAEVLTGLPASQVLRQEYTSVLGGTPWLVEMVQKSEPPRRTGSRGEGDLAKPRGRRVPARAFYFPDSWASKEGS